MLSDDAILKQSEAAYKQWHIQWREHAKIHSKFNMKDIIDFQNSGIGKPILAIANGYSLEENIETIKKYKDDVDIICVDKAYRPLVEHGIIPKFCLVCDANVNYERYLEPVRQAAKCTILFSNVCGNPDWTHKAHWKDIYFFVNMDILKSEREFSSLSKCNNVIPAGTNVSNAMLVFLNQSDNRGPRNFFGYDKILLVGYDYCWDMDKYYAFDGDGNGKQNYMRHIYLHNINGDFVFTSSNLLFSAKWLDKYIRTFNIHAYQCSKYSIFPARKVVDLESQVKYLYKTEDAKKVQDLIQYKRDLAIKLANIDREIIGIGRDHLKQVIRTV